MSWTKASAVVLALSVVACARVSTVEHGPNGRALQHIEASSAAKGYEKASEMCPRGYDMLTWRQQGLTFILDVECR